MLAMSLVGGIVHCSVAVADDVPHFQYVQQPLVLCLLLLRFSGSAHVVQDCDGQYEWSWPVRNYNNDRA